MTIRIDGEIIPDAAIQYELNRLVKFYSEHMSAGEVQSQMEALKGKAREQAIGAKLLIREAERLDFQVPPDAIEQKFQSIAKDAGGAENLRAILKKQGLAEEQLRKDLARGCRVDMLIQKVTEGVQDPTEAEIKAHFEAHAREYTKPERVQARHILIKPDSDKDTDKSAARSKLQELKAKIEEGADFSDLATIHSACPSGKKTGGSLGWMSRGMTIPEFDKVLFSLQLEELSDVVESPLGYHLIQKMGEDPGGEADFDEVRENVREFLRHARRGEAVSAFVAELRAKSVIEEN